jgi:hypothetical protein
VRQRATEAVDGAKQKFHDTLASITSLREPGQLARLRDAAVQQLPYHPQYIAKGTVYDAELSTPVSFGRAEPAEAGCEVVFAADTPIQVRLAPGPSKND